MEQQNPPGKPLVVLERVVIKHCRGDLGLFQDSALKGQIAFSCSENHWSSPRRRAQVLIYYWTCLKRHLGKSTRRQICNYSGSPRRAVFAQRRSRVHVQWHREGQHGRVSRRSRSTCWYSPSSRSPGSERCRRQTPKRAAPLLLTRSDQWAMAKTLDLMCQWWGRGCGKRKGCIDGRGIFVTYLHTQILTNEIMWSCSVVSDSVIPWTAAYQAPPSMVFSRQEYCNGLPFP